MDIKNLIFLIFIWNLFVFMLYGYDKLMAKLGKWRIRERTLIISAFFAGGIGAILGMYGFHHKTEHKKFIISVSFAFVITVLVIAALLFGGEYING